MKRYINFFMIGTACLLVLGLPMAVMAFRTIGAKWSAIPVTYDKHTLNAGWVSAVWVGAFNWNDVAPSPFQWNQSDAGSNDVTLGPWDGQGGRLATTTVGIVGTNIVEMDIMFDQAEIWHTEGTPPGDELDAIGVATHELGHGLGLDDLKWWECLSNAPTMCPSYNYGDTHFRNLEQDDKNGLNNLYP